MALPFNLVPAKKFIGIVFIDAQLVCQKRLRRNVELFTNSKRASILRF